MSFGSQMSHAHKSALYTLVEGYTTEDIHSKIRMAVHVGIRCLSIHRGQHEKQIGFGRFDASNVLIGKIR